jgi:rSAM/selenodomain-associated transferase 2
MHRNRNEVLKYSIIIPVLNEASVLRICIHRVRSQQPDAEIIVVDGGSEDESRSIAVEEDVILLQSNQGRGVQCNAGAARASGEILLFLHADTILPENAFTLIDQTMNQKDEQIATFRIAFDNPHWLLQAYAYFSRFDSVFTRFADQCIVIRSTFFESIGRFPDWPIFEDVELLRNARRFTSIVSLNATAITSARRFLHNGIVKQQFSNAVLVARYLLGASPHDLALSYEQNKSGYNCMGYVDTISGGDESGQAMEQQYEIVFIYNADSGIFNSISDSVKKLLSPSTYSCSLCRISCGPLAMHKEWKEYLAALPHKITFLHKDELNTFEDMPSIMLPAIILKTRKAASVILVSPEELNGMDSVAQLIAHIQQRLSDYAKN